MNFDSLLRAERSLLASAKARSDVYESIHRAACALLPVDAFYVCLYEPRNRRLRFEYNADDDRLDTPEEFPVGTGPTSRAVRTGKVHVLNHVRDESSSLLTFGNPGRRSKGAIHLPFWDGPLGVPGSGSPKGVVSVQSYTLDSYGREHVQAVRWLAARTAGLLRETELEAAAAAARAEELRIQREKIETTLALHEASPELCRSIAVLLNEAGEPTLDATCLTDRELQSMVLAAQGHTYARIADTLGIGRETVKTYLPRAYAKLGLRGGRCLTRHLPTLLSAASDRDL